MSSTNTAPLINFWPYEERFELLTEGDLLRLPHATWKECSARAGATIVASDITPLYHSYVLSLSSLIVFPHRLVLMTCSEHGIAHAAEHLLAETAGLTPTYAACERRAPPGTSPYAPHASRQFPTPQHDNTAPLTKVSLFHSLIGRITLAEVQRIISTQLPQHSSLSHQFPQNGISLNALNRDSYLSLHYTEEIYLSLEGSFTSADQWEGFERIVAQIEQVVAPKIVVGSMECRPRG